MDTQTTIRFVSHVKRYGWYATRQNMLKRGFTLYDVAKVLALKLKLS